MKVLHFVLFFTVFVVWVYVSYVISKKLRKNLASGNDFLLNQAMILTSYGGFFAFVYFISGFWNLKLMAFTVASAQLGILVSWILWSFLGPASDKTKARLACGGAELALHPAMGLMLLLGGLVSIVWYPVTIGIGYFRHHWNPHDLTLWIFRYSLLYFFISGCLMVPLIVRALLSENVDQEARKRLLVSQFGGLIPWAFLLALAFWAFGLDNQIPISARSIELTISPRMVVILFAFFCLTALFPYLIGTRRAQKWQLELLKRRAGLTQKLINVLDVPSHSQYNEKLNQLQNEITDFSLPFFEADEKMKRVIGQMDASGMLSAYNLSRDLDPRLECLDRLREFQAEVEQVSKDLRAKETNPEQLSKSAADWLRHFQHRKAEVRGETEAANKLSPTFAIMITVLTPITSAILSGLGKWGWGLLSAGLPKK